MPRRSIDVSLMTQEYPLPYSRTLATLHGTRIRMLLQAEAPKASGTATPAMVTDPATAIASIVSTPTALPAFGMQPAYPFGVQIPSVGGPLQNVDLMNVQQSPPSLFNLPMPDSHALWDLFNESAAAAAGPAVPDARSGPQSPPAAAVGPTAGGQSGSAASDASTATPMTGTEQQTWTGPGARPDEWMYKSLDQDWLSSEPGESSPLTFPDCKAAADLAVRCLLSLVGAWAW